MTVTRHTFVDPISVQECTLIIETDKAPVVEHPDCFGDADVTVELDAFYCPTCRYNGRVSGAWVLEQQGATA